LFWDSPHARSDLAEAVQGAPQLAKRPGSVKTPALLSKRRKLAGKTIPLTISHTGQTAGQQIPKYWQILLSCPAGIRFATAKSTSWDTAFSHGNPEESIC